MRLWPEACVAKTENGACRSVANPGYSFVLMFTGFIFLGFLTSTPFFVSIVSTPASPSAANNDASSHLLIFFISSERAACAPHLITIPISTLSLFHKKRRDCADLFADPPCNSYFGGARSADICSVLI